MGATPTNGLTTPTPTAACDDSIRKWVAGIDSIVFLILVGGICGYLMYSGKNIETDILAILIMVVQAMIGIIVTERSYWFGSSSGSTSKSTTIANLAK